MPSDDPLRQTIAAINQEAAAEAKEVRDNDALARWYSTGIPTPHGGVTSPAKMARKAQLSFIDRVEAQQRAKRAQAELEQRQQQDEGLGLELEL